MKKMKKILALVLTVALLAAAIGGTLAYLSDSDGDVNVMTLGNVYIEQIEQEWNEDKTSLVPFTQAKPLYPFVGEFGWTNTGEDEGAYRQFTMKNAVDKYVSVKNVGKSDAYVRTIIALEMGSCDAAKLGELIGLSVNLENGSEFQFEGAWSIPTDIVAQIDGKNYNIMEFVHSAAIEPDETTVPSLLQIYMRDTATNEDCKAIDGNNNGTYDILVLSQAVQTEGFADAKTALDTAFGEVTEENTKTWFSELNIPTVFSYEGVNYITDGDTATINPVDGDTVYRGIYSDGKTDATSVVINEGIKRLNNRALCKAPTLTSVSLPDSLTYIDEGVFQQSEFTTIEIPENVTYIGKTAFGACPELETIVIKAKDVTFANYVGRDSGKLKEVYIYSDTVTFESGSMYFTNKQTGDASGITFYVSSQNVADALYNSSSASRSYGMLIKSIDGETTYYNTLK